MKRSLSASDSCGLLTLGRLSNSSGEELFPSFLYRTAASAPPLVNLQTALLITNTPSDTAMDCDGLSEGEARAARPHQSAAGWSLQLWGGAKVCFSSTFQQTGKRMVSETLLPLWMSSKRSVCYRSWFCCIKRIEDNDTDLSKRDVASSTKTKRPIQSQTRITDSLLLFWILSAKIGEYRHSV